MSKLTNVGKCTNCINGWTLNSKGNECKCDETINKKDNSKCQKCNEIVIGCSDCDKNTGVCNKCDERMAKMH